MRILMVHNRYRSRGGEDQTTNAEATLLRRAGHHVDIYGRDNLDIPDMDPLGWRRLPTGARLGARTVWSRTAYRDVCNRLADGGFDVVHVQNSLPQVSPSALYAARSIGVPVVHSLRDYRTGCARGTLYRDGAPCDLCVGRTVPTPAVRYRCYQDDPAATSAVAAMQAVHRTARTLARTVSVFIALSQYAAARHAEAGVPADRMVVKPNFLAEDPGVGPQERAGFVYVGRLATEKGVNTLLEAWKTIEEPLTIIGGGPLAEQVLAAAQEIPQVTYAGTHPPAKTLQEVGAARAVIVPSHWHEPFERVVVEAFARATPVLASKVGALPELIDDGETGLLFEPDNPAALARTVHRFLTEADRSLMGKSARIEYLTHYTAEANYPQLLAIYHRAIMAAGP